MRIGCLQFAPQVGDVDNNLNRADAVLNRANPEDLDLLVLPELAFSGYNFKSLRDIVPFLEPSKSGITSLWARTTALKHNCVVAAGYPEKVDVSQHWPTSPEYYNSLIVVNSEGETIANYRKTHLYYTDETWALENPNGFYRGYLPGIGRAALGICMDLKFEAPWSAFEFAFHVLDMRANVVIMSMAWLTREDAREFSRLPKEPDMDTLTYWVRRLEPLIRSESDDEIIVIFANRTGMEGDAVYAGTSAVIGIKGGEVSVYGLLGRGEKELLVVDTAAAPFAQLVYRPERDTVAESDAGTHSGASSPREATDIGPSGSPSPSTMSKSPNAPGSRRADAGSSTGPSDANGHDARSISGSHMLITPDPSSFLSPAFPATPFEESPISPRYFWALPDHPKAPGASHSPTSSPRPKFADAFTQQHGLTRLTRRVEDATRNSGPAQTAEVRREVNSLQGGRSSHPPPPEPGSSSRVGGEERFHSTVAAHPSSSYNIRASGATADPAAHLPLSHPRSSTLQDEASGRLHSPPKSHDAAPDHRQRPSASPDLEKIGADLMVFEEGTRPRRDSLECHADEDDFVVFHSSRTQRHKSHKREQPLSPRESDQPSRKNMKDTEERTSEHVSPRLTHTPSLGSPRSGNDHSQFSRSSTRTKDSSPKHHELRNLDRGGGHRDRKRSPQKHSPKLSQGPSPGLRSPHSKLSPAGSDQAGVLSRHKSPEPGPEEKVQLWNDQPSRRMGSTKGFRVTGNMPPADDSNTNKPRVLPEDGVVIHASSVMTIETHNSPTTFEVGLKTPKAMILAPGMDVDNGPLAAVVTTTVEPAPLKGVVGALRFGVVREIDSWFITIASSEESIFVVLGSHAAAAMPTAVGPYLLVKSDSADGPYFTVRDPRTWQQKLLGASSTMLSDLRFLSRDLLAVRSKAARCNAVDH
ncbi:hypothetical protein DL762_001578 [Monosporascus cannonballus]|uniref:CN hydrolase domain-containing protein n=1 Tax=Monosporascus cannonballus TaxID=155416 RepID=A0ABY0HKA9_9PEZI|nr:hypothetical protein DL762_001578 [Monosporascus cannonballus]RYP00305.1 hypothetical protein DL763_000916 [Monosporascus cannonballus]